MPLCHPIVKIVTEVLLKDTVRLLIVITGEIFYNEVTVSYVNDRVWDFNIADRYHATCLYAICL